MFEFAIASLPVMGICLEIAVLLGLFLLRVPLELAVLILIPFNVIIVGYFIPVLIPIIGILAGIVIGIAFLRIIRR